jgi:DNA replication protein DnaD
MNNFSTFNCSQKTVTIFFIFMFLLLCNVSAFSQTAETNTVVSSISEENSTEVKQDNKTTSNMEFVLWFMGSKQNPNSTISTEGINTKKQIMTSGIAPNRLLLKAFLKKAVNYEIAVV